MNFKYAFYCSGSAARVIKFYNSNKLLDFPAEFVYYDGGRDNVITRLADIFGPDRVIVPSAEHFNANKVLSKTVNQELLSNLNSNKVDYLFCFGDKILKPLLVDAYKNRIINFHPSILPAFPGLNAIDQALSTSVQLLGNTAHFIDKGIDTGPIILQSVISRRNFKNYDSVLDLQIGMLEKIWVWLETDMITMDEGRVIIRELTREKSFYSS